MRESKPHGCNNGAGRERALGPIAPLVVCAALLAWHPVAARPAAAATQLADLSLEELMNLEVSLVSRSEETLFEAASAVFVLTREDIRRSGAASLPEALRLVPGLQVARIDASKWAITPREGHFRFANKLLVLVDGRSVYSPLFSGVFWETQDLVLEDIEKIEVIRGPGATLWGANAVNGVINIVTRDASQALGTLVTAGGGTEERAFGVLRHGGRLGRNGHYRVYGKTARRDASVDVSGKRAHDGWDARRGGVRADWVLASADELTLQGELYDVEQGSQLLLFDPGLPVAQEVIDTARLSGGHAMASWRRRLSATADLSLQLYADRTRHREVFLAQRHHTFDIDVQHHFAWGTRHESVWGLWGRLVEDELRGSFTIGFEPESRRLLHYSLFAQDAVAFRDDRLHLILGSKFEHNPYTGLETQPNVRLMWTPRARLALWGAVSRAVRTPSRAERDGSLILDALSTEQLPVGVDRVLVVGEGRDDLVSEVLTALEAGVRVRAAARLSVDVAAYLHLLDKQSGIALGTSVLPRGDLGPVLPIVLENRRSGEDVGLEAVVDWETRPDWRQRLTYTFLQKNREAASAPLVDSDYSRHNVTLRSQTDLPGRCALDGTARYVSGLSRTAVEGYATLDLRFAWKARPGVEVSLVGQNLLQGRHAEAVEKVIDYQPTQVQRGVYTKVEMEF